MVDSCVKIIDAVGRLFAALGWPLVIIIAVIWLAPSLREFISRINTFSGKAAGIEFAIDAQKRDAANQIAAATAAQEKQKPETSKSTFASNTQLFQTVLNAALETTSRIQIPKTAGKQLLWVDDNPGNNIFERHALSALGILITTASSTNEAMSLVGKQSFDVIISDMSRPEGSMAGYELLDKLKQARIAAPFIIYAASATPQFIAEAKKRGAFGETNSPNELTQLVASALGANS